MKKLLFLFMLCIGGLAFAATTPNSVITVQTPTTGVAQFTASPGTYQTVYTGVSNTSKVISLIATSTDTSAAHLVTCGKFLSGTNYVLMAVNVPINSGIATGVPAVNLLSPTNAPGLPIDSDGNPYIYLPTGYTLQCTYATAFTSGKVLNIIAEAGDF